MFEKPDGEAPLVTEPAPTSFRKKKNFEKKINILLVTHDMWHMTRGI